MKNIQLKCERNHFKNILWSRISPRDLQYFWIAKRIHTCSWSWQHFHGVDAPLKRTNQFSWIKLWKRLIFIFHLETRLIMIFFEFGGAIHHFLKRIWLNHAGNKSQTWPRQIGLNFKDRVLSSEILKTIKCCNKSVKTIKRIAGTIMITSLDHIVLLKVF